MNFNSDEIINFITKNLYFPDPYLKEYKHDLFPEQREFIEKFSQCTELLILSPPDTTKLTIFSAFLSALLMNNKDMNILYIGRRWYSIRNNIINFISMRDNYLFRCLSDDDVIILKNGSNITRNEGSTYYITSRFHIILIDDYEEISHQYSNIYQYIADFYAFGLYDAKRLNVPYGVIVSSSIPKNKYNDWFYKYWNRIRKYKLNMKWDGITSHGISYFEALFKTDRNIVRLHQDIAAEFVYDYDDVINLYEHSFRKILKKGFKL